MVPVEQRACVTEWGWQVGRGRVCRAAEDYEGRQVEWSTCIQAKQNVFIFLSMDRKTITEPHTFVECAVDEDGKVY